MAGPIYGIFKNIASGKFGTQEGIRIADQAASEMMQKLTYEPESKSLTNFMSAVGDIATKYKLDAAIPQLLTVPIPGPASGRYAGVKTGEEIVDLMERQYAKQRDAGEFGERNPLRDFLLPTRKDIFQGAKSKNFDLTSASLFDKAEKEILTENPDISRYDLNIKSWQKTVDAVKRGEARFPTFRGLDNELRQEVPDTGFNFKLPMAMVGTTGSLVYPKNFESIKKGEKERGDGNVQMGFAPQKMILKEVDKGRNFFVVDAKNFSNYKDIDFDNLPVKDLLKIEAQEANPFKKVKLEEVIDFPDLFKAYENLKKNTFQIIKNPKSNVGGSFDASTGEIKATPEKMILGEVGSEKGSNTKAIEDITRSFRIKVSPDEKYFKETIKRLEDQGKRQQKQNFALQEKEKKEASKEYQDTILHEVQHAIQEMEGFAKGTNTNASRYNVSSLVESLGQRRRKLLEEENKIQDELNILKFEQPVSIPLNLELYKKQKQKKINNLLEKKRKLSEQEQVLEDLSQKFTRYARATDYYTYERSTGEAEARLVEKRKDLSMEERLKTFPLSDLDVAEDSLFPSAKFGSKADDDYQKQVNNFIIQQLGPKQAKDLGFDKSLEINNLNPLLKSFKDKKSKLEKEVESTTNLIAQQVKPTRKKITQSAKLSEDDFLNLASSGQLRQFRDDQESLESLFTDPNVKAQDIEITMENYLEGSPLALDYGSGDLEKRLNNAGFSYKDDGVGSLIVGRTKKDVDFLEKALDREKKVGSQYALGKMYGYSEADIAAFYKKRYSDAGLPGSKYFIRDKKKFEQEYTKKVVK